MDKRQGKDLHKPIPQTHHPNDQTIHTQTKSNNPHIKPYQAIILRKTLSHQPLLHDMYEIPIQQPIDDQVDAFLTAIPDIIEVYVFFRYLETGRHPDGVDGDIDCGNENGDADLQT
jgi:hypothetical protein